MENTTTKAFGDGFKAETKGIRDAACLGDAIQLAGTSMDVSYTAIGYSDLDAIVKLDPPRGKKSRCAVLLVDKIVDKTIEIQKAEYVEPDEAKGAVSCFQKLRQVCKQVKQTTTTGTAKRKRAESSAFPISPKDVKKCRNLKTMPTDASIESDD